MFANVIILTTVIVAVVWGCVVNRLISFRGKRLNDIFLKTISVLLCVCALATGCLFFI